MFARTQLDDANAIRRCALDLIARREHSRREMQRKLHQRGADKTETEAVLDRLEEQGLLSDERFCEAYVHARHQRGIGPQRLREELRQRGIRDHLIEQVLAGNERDWSALANEVFAKRFPEGPASDLAERGKQQRFMQYRGFAGLPDD